MSWAAAVLERFGRRRLDRHRQSVHFFLIIVKNWKKQLAPASVLLRPRRGMFRSASDSTASAALGTAPPVLPKRGNGDQAVRRMAVSRRTRPAGGKGRATLRPHRSLLGTPRPSRHIPGFRPDVPVDRREPRMPVRCVRARCWQRVPLGSSAPNSDAVVSRSGTMQKSVDVSAMVYALLPRTTRGPADPMTAAGSLVVNRPGKV